MHKLAPRFRFFLMSTLIIILAITAAIPFFNMNPFSNALAIELSSSINNDNLQGYSDYDSNNDNNYSS